MGGSGRIDRSTRRALMERLERDAQQLARRFGLRYRSLEAERANVKSRYGHCTSDGVIKIRLRHAVTGQALKYSSLVNTLCHELAHLRHFNHGERFKAFYFEILAHARAAGIYRPGPAPAAPAAAVAAVAAAPRPRRAGSGRGAPVTDRGGRGRSDPGPVQLPLF